MTCMKCGREIPAEQVFCDGCLEVMEKYPVKRDAAIHLPLRKEQSSSKKQGGRRRQLPPEEQVVFLRKRLRRARAAAVVLCLLFIVAAAGFVWQLLDNDATIPLGRNYTITTDQD